MTQAVEARVVVVGGGLAGLAVAWELVRRGVDALVLEREPRPGGRALSETREGFTLEPLSPVLSTADRELLAWIVDVGAGDDLLPLRPVLTAQAHGGRVAALEPPRGLRDLARIAGVRPDQALRLVRLPRLMRRYAAYLDPGAPERAADLDDRSLADFGRLYFGTSVLDYWLAPMLTAASLCDENEASRVHLLQRLRRVDAARSGLPRAPLRDLLERAAARLPTLCEAEVVSVEPSGEGAVVRYERAGRERSLDAVAVVFAVPAADAARLGRSLLSTAEREVLEGVRYTPSVTLAAATCRPLSWHPLELRFPQAEGSPLAVALLEPGMSGGRVPDGYGSVALRASGAWSARALGWTDERIERELLDALERVKPGSRGAVDFTRVFRVERALPRFDVGHYRALARLRRVEESRRREGHRAYTVGDYRMDPSWWGAHASALRTARDVARDLA
jgi:protoporphyrinogen oxidase